MNMLGEADRKRTPSPSSTASAHSQRSVHSTLRKQIRRKSAPVIPDSRRPFDDLKDSGVYIKHQTVDFGVDTMTASLLTSLVPGIKIGQSSFSKRSTRSQRPLTPNSTISSSRKKRPDLSLPIATQDSRFAKCDDVTRIHACSMSISSSVQPVAQENDSSTHLRRRSWKTASFAKANTEEREENLDSIYDVHVTRRVARPKLSPPEEMKEEEDCMPSPVSSPEPLTTEHDDDDERPLEDSRLEVSW